CVHQCDWLEPRLSHHADGHGGADVLHRRGRVWRGAGDFQPDGHAAGGLDDDHDDTADNDDDRVHDDDHPAADAHDQHHALHHLDHAAAAHESDGDGTQLQRGGPPLDALEWHGVG